MEPNWESRLGDVLDLSKTEGGIITVLSRPKDRASLTGFAFVYAGQNVAETKKLFDAMSHAGLTKADPWAYGIRIRQAMDAVLEEVRKLNQKIEGPAVDGLVLAASDAADVVLEFDAALKDAHPNALVGLVKPARKPRKK